MALQIGHRISVDFDFFSDKEIAKNLLPRVKKVFNAENLIASVNNADELTVFVGGVKITFLRYPFHVIDSLIELDGIKALSIKEIAATKAYSIGRRGTFKDYLDLYFVILGGHASLEEIILVAERKYGGEFNSRLFLEQLIFLEDVADADLIFLKEEVDRTRLKNFFKERIRELKI